MPCRRLATADRRYTAEQVHIPPTQVLDFDSATRRGYSEHGCTMGHHPFSAARGGFEQLAFEVRRKGFADLFVMLWQCLNVLRDGVPDLRTFQHPSEDARFHVHGSV